MLVAFDIGNTNVVVGVFEGSTLRQQYRMMTELGRTVDDYTATLFTLIDRDFGQDFKPQYSIVSSVVPPLTQTFVKICQERLKLEALVVGPGIRTGVSIRTEDPKAVGADRIVNSAAVKALYGTPAIVVDMGTATTFDFVSADGAYEGGAIAPGIGLATDALVRHTAKLPKIELVWPASMIGKNTVNAMQVGSVVGYVALVDGLVERMIEERGPVNFVVSTGGLGKLISDHSRRVKQYNPHLTLHGLRIISELNRS